MGEVSRLTGLEPHVLRNWEKNFSELRPKKNRAGNRAYREQEVELIFRIKELLLVNKFTVEGVQEILKAEKEEGPGHKPVEISPGLRKNLKEIRMFMTDLLEKL